MENQKWLAKTVFFPAFLLALFIVGWMIPTFYDWSGADQSYSTLAFDQMYWSLIAFGCLTWFVIPCLPMEDAVNEDTLAEDPPEEKASFERNPKRFQFNLYSLMVVTTILAILLALLAHQSVVLRLSILIWVVAFVSVVRMIVKDLPWKWQFSALLACMYFPYVWVLTERAFKNASWELLCSAIGLPCFVPVVFIGRFVFGTRAENMVWLWILMVVVEAAIGFCLIRKLPRCSIAYFVLVMLMSIYGSMFLNMGTRI